MCFDGESPECFTQIIRKARKEHKCYECRRLIAKGEQYEYSSGIWAGEAQSFKLCLDCVNLKSKIEAIELSHGCSLSESSPGFGELIEAAKEYGLIERAST